MGMSAKETISIVTPSGKRSMTLCSSMVLNEPLRKLPEMPIK
jgi:hypothetical protein